MAESRHIVSGHPPLGDLSGLEAKDRRVLPPGGKYVFIAWDDWIRSPDAPLARKASTAASARDAANATVQGSLIRVVTDETTNAVEQAIKQRFGDGAINETTRASVVTAQKP